MFTGQSCRWIFYFAILRNFQNKPSSLCNVSSSASLRFMLESGRSGCFGLQSVLETSLTASSAYSTAISAPLWFHISWICSIDRMESTRHNAGAEFLTSSTFARGPPRHSSPPQQFPGIKARRSYFLSLKDKAFLHSMSRFE